MTSEIGPDYRQVMNLIRSKIESGDWPVGRQIPSTAELRKQTGLSLTVVRRAVRELQLWGILEGHPGKGVFVKTLPADADRERPDLKALSEEVAELAELVKENDDLRARVGRIEAILISWASRLGYENPYGGARDTTEKAPRRGRAGR